jgi:hypothetical protein
MADLPQTYQKSSAQRLDAGWRTADRLSPFRSGESSLSVRWKPLRTRNS